MKVLELFSGYGTASFALKRLGIEHELVGFSDIDKYANQCFKQNHGGKELGDVRKVNPSELPDFDLLTAGFPCQTFSNAGKMQGEAEPRGTLFYEIIRIAEVKKPKFMLLENVKGLTCKKFKDTFNKILSELDRIGYNVYWKVLNSKDFGIPQSRARIWFVCFRKYIDAPMKFQFPEPTELKIFIKDILEKEVDKKYYLSPILQERFAKYLEDKESKIVAMRSYPRTGKDDINRVQNIEPRDDGCSNTLTAVQKDNLVCSVQLANMNRGKIPYNPEDREMGFQLNKEPVSFTIKQAQHEFLVYDRKGFDSRTKGFRESDLSPTLSMKMGTGGNNVPMILTGLQEHQQIKQDGTCNCLPSAMGEGGGHVPMVMNTITTAVGRSGHSREELGWIDTNRQSGQLRRLTPKECFRLMGFLNDEINLDGLSDTQRYKLAGNGQDVNMVSLIFKQMFAKQELNEGANK